MTALNYILIEGPGLFKRSSFDTASDYQNTNSNH